MYKTQLRGYQLAPTIRLREGVNDRLKREFGCTTDAALAAHMGIDASHWSRVTRHRSAPGPGLQAQLLIACTGIASFDELFEVVDDSMDRKTA